ncbi:MAG: DNA recombination protein RmuC [Pseudomonadota bacterium]
MKTLALAVQSETDGLESAEEALQSETAAVEPLITGPAPYLWAGVGSVLLIFIVGMMLIIRGRVVRAKPRQRNAEPQSYFEPAGENAEITFEDDKPNLTDTPSSEHWQDNEISDTQVAISRDDDDHHHDNGSLMDDAAPESNKVAEADTRGDAATAPEKKKKSAFAGLFSKSPETHPAPETGEAPAPEKEEDAGFFPDEPEPATAPEAIQPQEPASAPEVSAVDLQEQNRLADAEEAAREALRRAEDAEALAQDLKRANDETQNVMTLGLRRHEAALDERAEALMLMEKRLSDLSDEFQDRLQHVTLANEAPVNVDAPTAAAYHDPHTSLSEAHFAEFADLMGEQFDSLRGSVNAAIEKLSKRLDQIPAGAAPVTATAARIQLADLLRDVLAPKRYKLMHKLPNGRTADASITMPTPMAPIAVDARFPVEAFDAWQLSRNAGTEMALRRAVLRNVADAGEKLVSPPETADCAMMFVPSEQILSELHAHFSDVVQESYRARVWMVAPTSLMATLHTISAVMARAGIKDAAAANMMEELEALRARVAVLEAERAPQRSQTGAPSARGPAQYNDLFSPAPAESPGPAPAGEPATDEKSPFPLR